MEPKGPQFSAYDFLGYLLPGIVLLALMDVSYQFFLGTEVSIEWWAARYTKLSWENAIPLSLMGYFFGHIVSFISSVTIEHHAIRMYGHPDTFIVREVERKYFDPGKDENKNLWFIILRFAFRFLSLLFMLPVAWVEYLAGRFAKCRTLDARMHATLLTCLEQSERRLLSRLQLEKTDTQDQESEPVIIWDKGISRLGLSYALETAPAHLFTLRNYVVLYGFHRAMAFILLLVVWVCTVFALYNEDWLRALLILFGGGIAVSPCYGAYLKFWSRYYREAMMAFLAATAVRRETEDLTHTNSSS
jgi:hypothetical protein